MTATARRQALVGDGSRIGSWLSSTVTAIRRAPDQLRLRVGTRFHLEAWFRPGLFLPDRRLHHIRDRLCGVAERSIEAVPRYGVFGAERAPYCNRLIVIVQERHTGRDVAACALPLCPLDPPIGRRDLVVHLGLVLIDSDYRRQGLQFLLYGLPLAQLLLRRAMRSYWVSSLSRVPSIVGAVANQFGDVQPHYARTGPIADDHRAVARWLVNNHRHEFGAGPRSALDEETLILAGDFDDGDPLLKPVSELSSYRDEACNHFCRERLDGSRESALLQIGIVDLPALLRSCGRLAGSVMATTQRSRAH